MTDFDFDPPHREMRAHAASGFVFSGFAQLLKIGTQFLSVVVMARLLQPADFGLLSMVWPIYSFAMLFQNLGINQAVIQRPRLTAAQVNSFFWINSALGATVSLFLVLISPAVAWFYHDPRVVALTIAMAALVVTSGLGNLHGAIMVRRLQFQSQMWLNVGSSIVSLAASILWGYFIGDYWALYLGMAVGTLIPLVASWCLVKWRPSRPALVPETGEMMKFGLGVATANIADLIANSTLYAVIGHSLGERVTGLFDRSTKLVSAPLQQVMAPINQVTGPILYRLYDDEVRYRSTYQHMASFLTLIITPFIMWVIAMPDLLIHTLMGAKWSDAAPIFVAVSLAALPQFVNGVIGWIFVTQGRSGDNGRWGVINAVVTVVALFAGLPFGIVGVASAIALSQFLRMPVLCWYACRVGPIRLGHLLAALIPGFAGGAAAYVVLQAFSASGLPAIPKLALGLILSYGVALAVFALFPFGRDAIKRNLNFVKFIFGGIGTKLATLRS